MPGLRDPRLFTTGRIAKVCKVAPRTVAKWIDSGLLPGYRLPGCTDRRVVGADLVPFLREHGVPIPPEVMAADPLCRVLLVGLDERLETEARAWMDPALGFDVRSASTAYHSGIAIGEHWPNCVVIDVTIGRIETGMMAANLNLSAGRVRPKLIAILPTDFTDELPSAFNEVLVKPVDVAQLAKLARP